MCVRPRKVTPPRTELSSLRYRELFPRFLGNRRLNKGPMCVTMRHLLPHRVPQQTQVATPAKRVNLAVGVQKGQGPSGAGCGLLVSLQGAQSKTRIRKTFPVLCVEVALAAFPRGYGLNVLQGHMWFLYQVPRGCIETALYRLPCRFLASEIWHFGSAVTTPVYIRGAWAICCLTELRHAQAESGRCSSVRGDSGLFYAAAV
jgi:hypothetical protein